VLRPCQLLGHAISRYRNCGTARVKGFEFRKGTRWARSPYVVVRTWYSKLSTSNVEQARPSKTRFLPSIYLVSIRRQFENALARIRPQTKCFVLPAWPSGFGPGAEVASRARKRWEEQDTSPSPAFACTHSGVGRFMRRNREAARRPNPGYGKPAFRRAGRYLVWRNWHQASATHSRAESVGGFRSGNFRRTSAAAARARCSSPCSE
jgi:hypothetical protein